MVDEYRQDQDGEKRVSGMMTWVRLLLPLALAALGWYIGQTVGNLDERLHEIEDKLSANNSRFIQHAAEQKAWQREIERRLTSDELTIEDLVRMDQFLQRSSQIERRVDRLEDRLNENNN